MSNFNLNICRYNDNSMETQYIPVADRPEVSLPNYKAVYEYYRDLEPDPIIARLGHLAVSLAYWPQAVFADGAEDAIGSDIDRQRTKNYAASRSRICRRYSSFARSIT